MRAGLQRPRVCGEEAGPGQPCVQVVQVGLRDIDAERPDACRAGTIAIAHGSLGYGAGPGAFALLLCFSVVAAPKNSLWNFAPLVVAAACGLAPTRGRLAPAVAAWTLIEMGGPLLLAAGSLGGHPVLLAWLSGLPLLGALVLLGQLLLGTFASPAASVGHEIEWTEPAAHAVGGLRRSVVVRRGIGRIRDRPGQLQR